MEEKCIICGSEVKKKIKAHIVPFLIERMFDNKDIKSDILYCENCNFYYSRIRPTDEQMAKLYSGYRNEEYQKQRQKHEPTYTEEFNKGIGFSTEAIKMRKKLYADVFDSFLNTSKPKKILDYGGDSGQMIPDVFINADKFVYDISGVAPIKGVSSIRKKEELKKHNWDFIMCLNVLEHVSDPLGLVNDILKIMPKGCYLYLEVPHDIRVENFNDENEGYIHEHINQFRKETFEQIFNSPEFVILKNTYMTHNHPVLGKIDLLDCLIQKVA